MGSAIFQALKLGFAIIFIALIFIFGIMMFRAMQYTQFANQSRRLIQETDMIPPNTNVYYNDTQHHKYDVHPFGSSSECHQLYIDRNKDYNDQLKYKIGNKLNILEKNYGYLFTIEPNNQDNVPKTYGHQIRYNIQIRVPYSGLASPDKANLNGRRVLQLTRPQSVSSILTNDSNVNNNQ